ncbi:MAG: LPS assembly protein LptD [Proteobacteria bacterium]|nr:LPS assembly protein LptD [Pseudomonadota bacterium]
MRLTASALTISLFLSATTALAKDQPFLLTADQITYDSEHNTVTAEGHIEILSEYGAVQANKIIYDQTGDLLTAEGDVLYLNEQEVAVFADRLELEGSLKAGAIDQLRVRMKNNGPALVAKRAIKTDENHYKLESAAYSACKACENGEGLMPWKIRADEIAYDAQEEVVSYKNAVLDVYGVPVVWVPELSHSVAKKKPRSGMLPPRFGRSGSRGEEVTLAYYKKVNENLDYTFRTRAMTERGVQLVAENRYAGKHASGEFRGSIIADDNTDTVRSHVDGSGEVVFRKGNRAGLSAQVASDDTYYDDFLGTNPSYLKSNAYAESASPLHYAAFNSTFFQDTRDGQDPGQTAQPLAQAQVERVFVLDDRVSQLNLSGNVLALHRGEGISSRRIVVQGAYNKPWMSADGDLLEFTTSLRGDIYNVDSTNNDDIIARGLPSMSVTWQRPYVSGGGNHTVVPQAMVIAAPRGGNPSEIPNEDSVAYELDSTNLFDESRFAGFDRIETGSRFIYGLDNQYGPGRGHTKYRLFIGQSLRFDEDSSLPSLGGTETRDSDWVGYTSLNPTPWFGLSSRFRLDNADLTARRMDNALTLGDINHSYATITYTYLDGGPEEVSARSRLYMTEYTYFESQARRDLADDGRLLLASGNIVYEHECYKLSFTVRRRGFSNRNVPPSTDYLFNIELLTLGRNLD